MKKKNNLYLNELIEEDNEKANNIGLDLTYSLKCVLDVENEIKKLLHYILNITNIHSLLDSRISDCGNLNQAGTESVYDTSWKKAEKKRSKINTSSPYAPKIRNSFHQMTTTECTDNSIINTSNQFDVLQSGTKKRPESELLEDEEINNTGGSLNDFFCPYLGQ